VAILAIVVSIARIGAIVRLFVTGAAGKPTTRLEAAFARALVASFRGGAEIGRLAARGLAARRRAPARVPVFLALIFDLALVLIFDRVFVWDLPFFLFIASLAPMIRAGKTKPQLILATMDC
jgi:hypothetical protein